MQSAYLCLGVLAGLTLATPSLAQVQDTAPEPSASDQPGKTWHVMMAIYEPYGPARCESWVYKVSTHDPMVIQGPPVITQKHADYVVNAWLAYLEERSPTAFNWINGASGNHINEIYFRTTEAEARAAFKADGHMVRDTDCPGSVLLKHGVDKFAFTAPADFTAPDFGEAPAAPPAPQLAAKDPVETPEGP